jgi:hypothetical protein
MRVGNSRRRNPYDKVGPRVDEILESDNYPQECNRLSDEYLEGVLQELVSGAPYLDLEDQKNMKQEAGDFAKKKNVLCTHDDFAKLLTREQGIQTPTAVDAATRGKEILQSAEYPPCPAHLNPSTLLTALTSIVTVARGPPLTPSRLAAAYQTFTCAFSITSPPPS